MPVLALGFLFVSLWCLYTYCCPVTALFNLNYIFVRVYVCVLGISAAMFLYDICKVVYGSYPSLNFFSSPLRSEWGGKGREWEEERK